MSCGEHRVMTSEHCGWSTSNSLHPWHSPVVARAQGSVACGVQRTTYATHMTTTPQWMGSVTTIPTAWDGAVVSAAAAAGTSVT